MLHPDDLDGDLVEVPLVSDARQPPPDPIGELLTDLERLLPHGLMAAHDAARCQHLLDHAEAERDAEVQPQRLADDLGRDVIAGMG